MTETLREVLDRVLRSTKKALIRGAQVPEEEVVEVPAEMPAPAPTGGEAAAGGTSPGT